MTQNSLGSLQYMVEVGVSRDDVHWLKVVADIPWSQLGAETRARIKRIQDQAYLGLLSCRDGNSQPVLR